jgi:hypothetical protein
MRMDERLYTNLDEVVSDMADAVCDMSDGLSEEAWHHCLDELLIILRAHRDGEANR